MTSNATAHVRILRAGLNNIDETLAQARRILALAEYTGNTYKAAEYRWLIEELEALKAQQEAQGAAV